VSAGGGLEVLARTWARSQAPSTNGQEHNAPRIGFEEPGVGPPAQPFEKPASDRPSTGPTFIVTLVLSLWICVFVDNYATRSPRRATGLSNPPVPRTTGALRAAAGHFRILLGSAWLSPIWDETVVRVGVSRGRGGRVAT
jgi:hypothetical protein